MRQCDLGTFANRIVNLVDIGICMYLGANICRP